MIEEAGGRVSRFDNSPIGVRSDQVIATNGLVHERMIELSQPRRT